MKKKFSFRRIFHSLRARIFLFAFLMGTIPCFILSSGLSYVYDRETLNADILSVSGEAQILINQIVTSGYLMNPTDDTVNITLSSVAQSFSGRILVMDDTLRVVKDTYSLYEGKTIIWDIAVKASLGTTAYEEDRENSFLTVAVPITVSADKSQKSSPALESSDETADSYGVLLFVSPLNQNLMNQDYQGAFIIFFLFIDVIISFLLAFFFSRRLTRPVTGLASSIRQVEKGFIEPHLSENRSTETGEVEEAFNSYAAELNRQNESRQEFVSNVSHELKTPLTSMKVLADSLNGMEDAPVDLYKDFMEDITGEIDRETKIINDLLTLVKFDKNQNALDITQVRINDLVETVMKRIRPIAEKAQVELVLESFRPITAEVDETKFSLAVQNLVENAVKYNNPGGYVHVSLNSDHRYFYIHVEDNGLGIPEESIPHIFERFYRADKSHSREIGGTGLGLSITQNVIRMHKGEIKVSSRLGEGTRFVVRVPLKYIGEEAADEISE